MLRRSLTFIILTAMTIHCAGRIGVLSYLYEQRNVIAFSIGLLDEIPIAVCSSQYENGKNLKIQVPDSSPASSGITSAQEIHLFIVGATSAPVSPCVPVNPDGPPSVEDHYDLLCISSIFHPPLI